MKLTAALLAVVVSAAAALEDEITFTGSSTFYGQSISGGQEWSEIPDSFWRWRFNPVLNLYGIPVVASVFVSSESSLQRQNMNRIYISSSPSASRESSVLSFVSSIGIGTFNPSFSDLTLNAADIAGVNLELTPGDFYFAAAGGRNRRGVEPDDDSPGTYSRDIYAVKTGVGSPFQSHVHLCMLYGKDKAGSIREDSTFLVTPGENLVASLDFGTVMFSDNFRLNAEIAGSSYTRDTRSPEVDSDEVPQWVLDLAGINVSTGFGWALDAASSVKFTQHLLSVNFRRTGPGFASMGSPWLKSDEMSAEARADRFFLNRKLTLGVWYGWNTDNLTERDASTSTGNTWGVRTGISFPDYPRLFISYSPSATITEDSVSSEIRTSMLSVSASYRRDIAGLDVNSHLAFSLHDNSAGTGSTDYSSSSIMLRETVTFHRPVVLTGCLYARRVRTGSLDTWSYTGDLRGTWYPSRSLSLTCGGYYTRGHQETKKGAVINGGFPICSFLKVNVKGEYSVYYSTDYIDYTRTLGGAGLTVIW